MCGIFAYTGAKEAGKLLLEGFFLKIEAAQSGDLQMTAFGLTGQQRRIAFFDSTGLHDGCHDKSIVYTVNAVKQRERERVRRHPLIAALLSHGSQVGTILNR